MTKKRRPKAQLEEVKRRGAKIAENPKNIKTKSSILWKVHSQTVVRLCYAVSLCAKGLVCECPYSDVGHGVCKHIIAIMHEISRTWTAGSPIHISAPDGCHYCHSKNTVKNGKRKYKRSRKEVQRYLCRNCKRTFSGTLGFKAEL